MAGRYFAIIQIMVCGIALLLAIFLKLFGGNAYAVVRNWYQAHMNDSIIVEDQIEDIRAAWSELFFGERNQPEEQEEEVSRQQETILLETNALLTSSLSSRVPVGFSVLLDSPLPDGVITSGFGDRSQRGENPHQGLDLAADEGSAVFSALPGKVSEVGWNDSYGNYIRIDHGNSIQTLYAHCESVLKEEGESVSRGEEVARVGSTGQSTGPHVHFELIVGEEKYDPQPLLRKQDL